MVAGWSAQRPYGSVPVIAGLLLAAGSGTRYGGPKALVERDGALLVERGLATLRAGGCTPIVVVLGAAAEEVAERADLTGALVTVNDDWVQGMGSSLRTGLALLEPTPADAVVVLLVDTPGVTAEAVRRVAAHRAPDGLVIATYRGQPGHPVLLGRAHWTGAAELAVGDVGARRYLAMHAGRVRSVACDDIADGTDLDYRPAAPSQYHGERAGEAGTGIRDHRAGLADRIAAA